MAIMFSCSRCGKLVDFKSMFRIEHTKVRRPYIERVCLDCKRPAEGNKRLRLPVAIRA